MFRSRQALRRALLSLLERKQFDQITIRDIVAEAGIGYATFFRHHAAKEDLLNEIASEQIGRLVDETLPLVNAADTSSSPLAICTHVGKHRSTWAALLTGGAGATLRADFIRLAREWAPRIQTSNDLPVEMGVASGVANIIEILAWWLRQPPDAYSAKQVAGYIERLVVAPLTAPAPGKPARAAKQRRR